MNKFIVTAALAGLLTSAPALYALAQTTTTQQSAAQTDTTGKTQTGTTTANQPAAPATTTAATSGVQWYSSHGGELRSSKLVGMTVRNGAGDNIGKVNELLLDSSGKVEAVVIGVGGFLGMGEHEVAVVFNSLRVTQDSNGNSILLVDATKDALKAAPQWTGSNS